MFRAAALGAALFSGSFSALLPTPARAQSGADAGASAPEQAAPPAPPAVAEANATEPEASDPGKGAGFVPKTLRDGQRLPDNLQSWLHERGGSRPTRIARHAASASALAAHEQPHPGSDESARAVRSRRMRSFDEAGITVLSNRLSQSPASLARVTPARIAEPAPRPRRPEPTEVEPELEPEPSEVTETRSLRAKRAPARHSTFDDGFGWASLAAGGSALGLAALWFRRRGRPQRS